MEPVLLDTDILSEVLKGIDRVVSSQATSYRKEYGYYTTSAVTVTEIVKGFQRLGRDDRAKQFVAALGKDEVLPLDRELAVIAGRIYGELERSGQPIDRADPMIAGIAIHHRLKLVTGNTKHFERIVELGFPLSLEDWRSEQR